MRFSLSKKNSYNQNKPKRFIERQRQRETEVKEKSKIPAIVIAFISSVLLLVFILFLDPQSFGIIPLFFLICFVAVFFTLTLLLKSTFRGLLYTTAGMLFLILRYFGIGNVLNLILIVGIVISIEIFISSK